LEDGLQHADNCTVGTVDAAWGGAFYAGEPTQAVEGDGRVRKCRRRDARSFWVTLAHDFSSRNSLARRSFSAGGCSMKITEDVRKYVADQGVSEQEALQEGMEEKSREFAEKGSELYAKA
jgi:ribosomal protein L20